MEQKRAGSKYTLTPPRHRHTVPIDISSGGGSLDDSVKQMIEDTETLTHLIGRRVRYQQQEYEVTDLLPEEGLLIISADHGSDVQEDSYGRASRLVPKRHNLKFRDADGAPTAIWDELAFLDGPLSG